MSIFCAEGNPRERFFCRQVVREVLAGGKEKSRPIVQGRLGMRRFGKCLTEEGGAGEEWDDVDAARFDGLAPAFFTVDENDAECDFAAFAFDGVDGFERGSASGDDIVDHDDGIASFEVAFDLFARAVAFRFFTDSEDLECFVGVLSGGCHADCERNGVGSESHAADGVDLEVFGMDF